MEMDIPVIDFSKLEGEERGETMATLHEACQKGFFEIENHGIVPELVEKVKLLAKAHYENYMKPAFLSSDTTKIIENNEHIRDRDWESSFLIRHRPNNTINDDSTMSIDLRQSIDEYINQLIKLTEKLSELMCENLGLNKSHITEAFVGCTGPTVGTKVAMYPECPQPELMRGLREHTDAGGIILMIHDGHVSGLEYMLGNKWVKIPPTKNNRICVGTGDQVEILSNGIYKSALHRVMAMKEGNRLSLATFYNPSVDAVISPAPELQPPSGVCFKDYLDLYSTTKFGDKVARFQSLKHTAVPEN